MEGFNIALKLNAKTILGRTQEDLNISAKIKESLTKDSEGVADVSVVGHDVTFKVSALMKLDGSASATKLDRDDVIALALKNGNEAVIPFIYSCGTDGKAYNGNLVITGYSESSNSEITSDPTISLDCRVTGAFTPAA